MNLFNRLIAWRIARHDARAKVFAAATAAATLRGDRANAARFRADLDHAAAVRDGLQQLLHRPIVRAGGCPPCSHNCREGRDCPARN